MLPFWQMTLCCTYSTNRVKLVLPCIHWTRPYEEHEGVWVCVSLERMQHMNVFRNKWKANFSKFIHLRIFEDSIAANSSNTNDAGKGVIRAQWRCDSISFGAEFSPTFHSFHRLSPFVLRIQYFNLNYWLKPFSMSNANNLLSAHLFAFIDDARCVVKPINV